MNKLKEYDWRLITWQIALIGFVGTWMHSWKAALFTSIVIFNVMHLIGHFKKTW